MRPDPVGAIHAAGVPSLGDRVARRIARVAPHAPALASAMAILGDGGALATAGALTGISGPEAGRIAYQLRRIEVLSAEDPFTFVHPLVRRSVYEAMPATERDAHHAAAAALLREAAAPPEAVAVHLDTIAPRASTEVATTMMQAAEGALAHIAPDEALRWFRRALEEGASEPPAAAILARLGATEVILRVPEAIPHLETALELADDPELRPRIAVLLADCLFLTGA